MTNSSAQATCSARCEEVYDGDQLFWRAGLRGDLCVERRDARGIQSQFREMPWLAVPYTHAAAPAALRQLFEVSETNGNVVVLVDREGRTITRDGAILLELAYSCSSALRTKLKNEKHFEEERVQVEAERKKLGEQLAALRPLEERLRRLSAKLGALKPRGAPRSPSSSPSLSCPPRRRRASTRPPESSRQGRAARTKRGAARARSHHG